MAASLDVTCLGTGAGASFVYDGIPCASYVLSFSGYPLLLIGCGGGATRQCLKYFGCLPEAVYIPNNRSHWSGELPTMLSVEAAKGRKIHVYAEEGVAGRLQQHRLAEVHEAMNIRQQSLRDLCYLVEMKANAEIPLHLPGLASSHFAPTMTLSVEKAVGTERSFGMRLSVSGCPVFSVSCDSAADRRFMEWLLTAPTVVVDGRLAGNADHASFDDIGRLTALVKKNLVLEQLSAATPGGTREGSNIRKPQEENSSSLQQQQQSQGTPFYSSSPPQMPTIRNSIPEEKESHPIAIGTAGLGTDISHISRTVFIGQYGMPHEAPPADWVERIVPVIEGCRMTCCAAEDLRFAATFQMLKDLCHIFCDRFPSQISGPVHHPLYEATAMNERGLSHRGGSPNTGQGRRDRSAGNRRPTTSTSPSRGDEGSRSKTRSSAMSPPKLPVTQLKRTILANEKKKAEEDKNPSSSRDIQKRVKSPVRALPEDSSLLQPTVASRGRSGGRAPQQTRKSEEQKANKRNLKRQKEEEEETPLVEAEVGIPTQDTILGRKYEGRAASAANDREDPYFVPITPSAPVTDRSLQALQRTKSPVRKEDDVQKALENAQGRTPQEVDDGAGNKDGKARSAHHFLPVGRPGEEGCFIYHEDAPRNPTHIQDMRGSVAKESAWGRGPEFSAKTTLGDESVPAGRSSQDDRVGKKVAGSRGASSDARNAGSAPPSSSVGVVPPKKIFAFSNESKFARGKLMMIQSLRNLFQLREKVSAELDLRPLGELYLPNGAVIKDIRELQHGDNIVATKNGGVPFFPEALPTLLQQKLSFGEGQDAMKNPPSHRQPKSSSSTATKIKKPHSLLSDKVSSPKHTDPNVSREERLLSPGSYPSQLLSPSSERGKSRTVLSPKQDNNNIKHDSPFLSSGGGGAAQVNTSTVSALSEIPVTESVIIARSQEEENFHQRPLPGGFQEDTAQVQAQAHTEEETEERGGSLKAASSTIASLFRRNKSFV